VNAPEFAIVGRVRKAHGIHGELVLETLTDAPDAIFASGRRVFGGTMDGDIADDRVELTVDRTRPFKEGLLVHFREIGTRSEAERWLKRYVLVPTSELEPPDENEVYVHELLGMEVRLPSGIRLGEVAEFYELPQGLMLEVRLADRNVLLPFRPEIIVAVDGRERTITAQPPDGLLD
jgi:16S rRNA processing protein RimM